MQEKIIIKTVQEEWMGKTENKEESNDQEQIIVAKEGCCLFD